MIAVNIDHSKYYQSHQSFLIFKSYHTESIDQESSIQTDAGYFLQYLKLNVLSIESSISVISKWLLNFHEIIPEICSKKQELVTWRSIPISHQVSISFFFLISS